MKCRMQQNSKSSKAKEGKNMVWEGMSTTAGIQTVRKIRLQIRTEVSKQKYVYYRKYKENYEQQKYEAIWSYTERSIQSGSIR